MYFINYTLREHFHSNYKEINSANLPNLVENFPDIISEKITEFHSVDITNNAHVFWFLYYFFTWNGRFFEK